ncbi:trypsin-like serine protease [Actinokineospora sp. 24-640]
MKLSRPVSLPVLPIATTDGNDGGMLQVMGWGAASPGQGTLHKAFVPFVSDEECKQTFNPSRDFRAILCAGGGVGVGVCSGDSGGPLIKRKPSGAKIQVGIVSFGKGACADGDPDGYVQVSFFSQEILAAAENLSDY